MREPLNVFFFRDPPPDVMLKDVILLFSDHPFPLVGPREAGRTSKVHLVPAVPFPRRTIKGCSRFDCAFSNLSLHRMAIFFSKRVGFHFLPLQIFLRIVPFRHSSIHFRRGGPPSLLSAAEFPLRIISTPPLGRFFLTFFTQFSHSLMTCYVGEDGGHAIDGPS